MEDLAKPAKLTRPKSLHFEDFFPSSTVVVVVVVVVVAAAAAE